MFNPSISARKNSRKFIGGDKKANLKALDSRCLQSVNPSTYSNNVLATLAVEWKLAFLGKIVQPNCGCGYDSDNDVFVDEAVWCSRMETSYLGQDGTTQLWLWL